MEFQDDSAEFPSEDVEQIVKAAIHACFPEEKGGDKIYNPRKVNDWINTIVDSCLKNLVDMERPFKYIITCIIMQKNGAGMDAAASMFWDNGKDGCTVVPWENSTMHCVVTVYGLALHMDSPSEYE